MMSNMLRFNRQERDVFRQETGVSAFRNRQSFFPPRDSLQDRRSCASGFLNNMTSCVIVIYLFFGLVLPGDGRCVFIAVIK